MAVNYSEQVKFTGKGYLDAKVQPVEDITALNKISRTQRFIGLTVTVLNDGTGKGPRDYWLKESTARWVLKTMPHDTIEEFELRGSDLE